GRRGTNARIFPPISRSYRLCFFVRTCSAPSERARPRRGSGFRVLAEDRCGRCAVGGTRPFDRVALGTPPPGRSRGSLAKEQSNIMITWTRIGVLLFHVLLVAAV